MNRRIGYKRFVEVGLTRNVRTSIVTNGSKTSHNLTKVINT
ncbi:hypothetical protein PL9214640408 [Planktothrix tepida PCC 9214]|uniref:Uncharacterized protein n=1 Tax=Planktothrix tepida PCC 9214 TaxID=671072 RepID=A0A1J1LS77_9CYAN|nr:hypothetical protein PL9214640408 [Planktothrix tepida PCC 9214]